MKKMENPEKEVMVGSLTIVLNLVSDIMDRKSISSPSRVCDSTDLSTLSSTFDTKQGGKHIKRVSHVHIYDDDSENES